MIAAVNLMDRPRSLTAIVEDYSTLIWNKAGEQRPRYLWYIAAFRLRDLFGEKLHKYLEREHRCTLERMRKPIVLRNDDQSMDQVVIDNRNLQVYIMCVYITYLHA